MKSSEPAKAADNSRPRWRSSTRPLHELHREFLNAGSQVLRALTFFRAREKLSRGGCGEPTESIITAAVHIAREVGEKALVTGAVSRTQLFEHESLRSGQVRDLIFERVRLLTTAGVDCLILETFFHLQKMLIVIECSLASSLLVVATMTFRQLLPGVLTDILPPVASARCRRQVRE